MKKNAKKKVDVAILGGSGYTGMELLRILAGHPRVSVAAVTSRQYAGVPVVSVFPALADGGYDELHFCAPSDFSALEAGFIFCALPHGASMEVVPALIDAGKRVIDLSADFRLQDTSMYEAWYGAHTAKETLKKAVYGLPEIYRSAIKKACFIANPGCYPTGAALALAPVLRQKRLVDETSIIIDSKSGVSGAGRGANVDTSYAEVAEGFKAYKVVSHRHTPEIEQTLSYVRGRGVTVTFTPHLLPATRGILTTAYVNLKKPVSTGEVLAMYADFYKGEKFVRVLPEGAFPNISHVRGSNRCDIGLRIDMVNKRAVIVSAIDNLVKGASGQAVQNLNLMCGFAEDQGLDALPLGI